MSKFCQLVYKIIHFSPPMGNIDGLLLFKNRKKHTLHFVIWHKRPQMLQFPFCNGFSCLLDAFQSIFSRQLHRIQLFSPWFSILSVAAFFDDCSQKQSHNNNNNKNTKTNIISLYHDYHPTSSFFFAQ
jgi:hypothetical protein